jgi:hypothetical protein
VGKVQNIMSWTYTVDKGIKNQNTDFEIDFNSNRTELREKLTFEKVKNKGRFDREDSYEGILGTDDFIRLSFDDSDKLQEIEMLSGTVYVNEIRITIGGRLKQTKEKLENTGLTFIDSDYGFTNKNFKFDLGDGEKSGGNNDEISWFYASTDISHLLEDG